MTELFFEKLSRFSRLSQPCTISIPFRQGQLTDVGMLSIEDEGKKLPTQKSILSTCLERLIKMSSGDSNSLVETFYSGTESCYPLILI